MNAFQVYRCNWATGDASTFSNQNWVKGYRIWTIEIGVPRMLMNIPKWHDTPLMFQANQVGHHLLFLPPRSFGAMPQLGDVPCISDILGARPCIKKPVRAPILFGSGES